MEMSYPTYHIHHILLLRILSIPIAKHDLAKRRFQSYEFKIDSWIVPKDYQFFQRGIRTMGENDGHWWIILWIVNI